MTIGALVEELASLQVDLALEGGRLLVNAPRGVLTPELKARIRHERELIVPLLESRERTLLEPIERRAPEQPTRLTSAQRQLWFLDRLDPGGSFLNVPLMLRLSGQLDVDALSWVITELGRRHDALCSEIVLHNDDPFQRVDGLDLQLEFEDYSHLDDHERERTIEGRCEEELGRPFDLEARAPLARFFLFRAARNEHVLLVVVHHVVFDGASQDLLLEELKELYAARTSGQPMPEAPALRFADFARWQERRLEGAEHAADLRYWTERLAGMPPQLELPTDQPRGRQARHAARRTHRTLDPRLTVELQRVARAHGATLNMLALASLELLLWRYSGQSDFGIGVPLQNRARPECERVIGMFVNTLVLRSEVPSGGTFSELLLRVRDSQIEALSHRNVAFEDILEVLAAGRDPRQGSLFQALFSYQKGSPRTHRVPGLELQVLPCFSGSAIADLVFWIRDYGDELWLAIDAACELFGAETSSRLFRSWQRLLEAIAEDPSLPLHELAYLDQDDQDEVLIALNDNAVPWQSERLVHRLFEAVVDERPDDLALIFEDQRLSYGELDTRANRLAHALVERGVGPDVRVGLCVHRGVEQVVAMLAVLKAGGGYVGLDPSYPADRISALLRDSAAPVLVSSSDIAARIESDAERLLLDRDAESIAACDASRLARLERSEQLAYVIYTSGSSGKPKGVMVEHRNVTSFFAGIEHCIEFDDRGVMLSGASISFDMSVIEILASLCHGRQLVLLGESVLGEVEDQRYSIPKLVRAHGVTHFQCTPSQAQMLLYDSAGRAALAALDQLLVGGEALPQELCDALCKVVAGEVINVYGPTETTVYATTALMRCGERVSIGRPLPNTRLFVLDSWGQPVPKGAPGELFVGGPGVTRGYLAEPELTKQRFLPNHFDPRPGARLYRTGDLVRYAPDGSLLYLGRNDRQLKIRGYRIELGEVEAVLRKQPGVDDAVVVARGDGAEKRLVGYLVPGHNYAGDDVLRSELRRVLPEYMLPAALVSLAALPHGSNGKLDISALPEPSAPAASPRAHVAARDERERKLCEIWRRALSVPQISVTDGFFELGGHSLLAVRIVNDVERTFGVRLPLATLFEHPTVEHFARHLAGLGSHTAVVKAPEWTSVVPIQPRGSLPPLFCVAGVGGNPMNLRHLAAALGDDQPFYGLQLRGVDGRLEPHRRIRDMALEFVADIRRLQPEGPYFIGGYSAGGLCAYEMAQLLRDLGEPVASVVFFDTLLPQLPQWTLLERIDAHIQNYRRQGLRYVQNRIAARIRDDFVRLARAVRARLARSNPFKYRHDAVWAASEEATQHYRPEPYDGDVLLLRADPRLSAEGGIGGRPHESNGWRELVHGELTVVELPCSHRDVVSEQAAALAAHALKKALAAARARRYALPAKPGPEPVRRRGHRLEEVA